MIHTVQCEICGRFISFADLDAGRAFMKEITPDSHVSTEDFCVLCPTHNTPENRRRRPDELVSMAPGEGSA